MNKIDQPTPKLRYHNQQENCNPFRNHQKEHDIQAALHFLKNLENEIKFCHHIDDLRHPIVMQKFTDTIQFLEKILST